MTTKPKKTYTCPNCGISYTRPITREHKQGRVCFSRTNRRKARAAGLRYVPSRTHALLRLAGVPVTNVKIGWVGEGLWSNGPRRMSTCAYAPKDAVVVAHFLTCAKRKGDLTTEYGGTVGGKGVYKDRATILKALLADNVRMATIKLGIDMRVVISDLAKELGLPRFNLVAKVTAWHENPVTYAAMCEQIDEWDGLLPK